MTSLELFYQQFPELAEEENIHDMRELAAVMGHDGVIDMFASISNQIRGHIQGDAAE